MSKLLKIERNQREYIENSFLVPVTKNADLATFCERTWCFEYDDFPPKAKVTEDNVAVAEFNDYEDWLKHLKYETRARIKRAAKRGLIVNEIKYSDDFAYGVWRIFNETRIRQGRKFSHYGVNLETVKIQLAESPNTFIAAYHGKELVGFIELLLGDDIGQIGQILSLESKRLLLPNNALIAKAVEVCSNHNLQWLVYARMGNHPSLDEFKRNNGFKKVTIKRYYIPLTMKGKIALLFGLQKPIQDTLPEFAKPLGYKLYNFISRLRT